CIATHRTPLSTSHLAISRRSAVKHLKRRTGCGSRSGLTATQCSLPPTSIPAASGCTISSAFQFTLFWTDSFCFPAGFFLLMVSLSPWLRGEESDPGERARLLRLAARGGRRACRGFLIADG